MQEHLLWLLEKLAWGEGTNSDIYLYPSMMNGAAPSFAASYKVISINNISDKVNQWTTPDFLDENKNWE